MRDIAPWGPAVALALLGGAGICLALPGVPGRAWLLWVPLVPGLWLWIRARGIGRAAGAAMVGLGLAGMHALWVLGGQLDPVLELREIQVTGRVVELPRHEQRRTRFLFDVHEAAMPVEGAVAGMDPEVAHALNGLAGRRLRVSWYDPFRGEPVPDAPRLRLVPGETWRFTVRVRAPRGLRNPGGFDAERHAFANRIAGLATVREATPPRRLAAGGGIDAWRQDISARIGDAVATDSARFIRALALGDVNGLSEEDWDALRAVGLTHLVAISGFHVGLVAGFFALWARAAWWCVPLLGRRWPRPLAAALAAFAGAAMYTALVGYELPTVRTSLMIGVVVLARCSRRHHRVVDALALAAITMVVLDPLSLLAPGFWLSFLGVAWLVWCLPGTGAAQSGWWPRLRGQLRDLVQAQGVASLGLLPLTVAFFGQASLAGPLANLVAVPWWSLVVVPLSLLGTFCEAVMAGSGAWLWRLAAWCFELSWPGFQWLADSPFALWWPARAPWIALLLAMVGAGWLLMPRGLPGRGRARCQLGPLLWPRQDRAPAGGGAFRRAGGAVRRL
ncbi:MAG: ComEC/Rec2 family competence protein, partial [Pseudoxanthomonas suwonensis]|nr:ComEC/Rec2 family competence protein [Pseudoxanthomonas suwonensis]